MPKQSDWQRFVKNHAGKGLSIQQLSKMYQAAKKGRSINDHAVALNVVKQRDDLERRLASAERDRAMLKDQLHMCQEYMRKSSVSHLSGNRKTI